MTPTEVQSSVRESLEDYIDVLKFAIADLELAHEENNDTAYFKALERHKMATEATHAGVTALCNIAIALGAAKVEAQ